MIRGANITFAYEEEDILKDISFRVRPGELVAVLGRNGSGKTTLARHINALLRLQQGSLTVAGIDVSDRNKVWKIRRTAGMIFQNPDNQFVSSVVEEDIAFGLENYEVDRELIPDAVMEALRSVGMERYRSHSPHMLSGGQKQRVALAGVLALQPEIIIFDESTAMLDPQGRQEVLDMIRTLHEEGKTILMITHYAEESVIADQVIVMENGRIRAAGPAREILSNEPLLREAGLVPPLPVVIWRKLKDRGILLDPCPLTAEELVEGLCP